MSQSQPTANDDLKRAWVGKVLGVDLPGGDGTRAKPSASGDNAAPAHWPAVQAALRQWRQTSAGYRKQANSLKSALIRELAQTGRQDSEAALQQGWNILENELAEIETTAEDALIEAAEMPLERSIKLLETCISDIQTSISTSVVLKDIDQNDLFPVKILSSIADMRKELQNLVKEISR